MRLGLMPVMGRRGVIVMPKEVIRSTQYIPETDEAPGAQLAVEVRWSKEQGHVSIATVDLSAPPEGTPPDPDVLERFVSQVVEVKSSGPTSPMSFGSVGVGSATILVNGVPLHSGSQVVPTPAASHMAAGVHTGWYMDLTRAQINDLIMVLRRARDGAFGKDA